MTFLWIFGRNNKHTKLFSGAAIQCADLKPALIDGLFPQRDAVVTRADSENVSRDRPADTPNGRLERMQKGSYPRLVSTRLLPNVDIPILGAACDDVVRHGRVGRPGHVSDPVGVGRGQLPSGLFLPCAVGRHKPPYPNLIIA